MADRTAELDASQVRIDKLTDEFRSLMLDRPSPSRVLRRVKWNRSIARLNYLLEKELVEFDRLLDEQVLHAAFHAKQPGEGG